MLGATRLEAQPRRPERPNRAVFGGDESPAGNGQRLTARASIFGSYDDNVIGTEGNPALLGAQTQGYYSGLTAGVEYQRTGRKLSFGGDVGTAGRYYPDLVELNGLSPHASVQLNGTVGKTTISALQQADYSPYYSLRFAPGVPTAGFDDIADVDAGVRTQESVALEEREAYGLNTAVSVRQAFTPRSSVTATFGRQSRNFEQQGQADLLTQRGSLTYRHEVTKYAALRIGYGREEANYGGSLTGSSLVRMHLFDVGADYRRPLSFSRRTLVDFKMGGTAVEGGLTGERVYRVVGDLGLTHEIGRTWELRGTYHRGAGLVEGLAEPVFSDGVMARLSGLLTRRVELAFDAAYTEGEIGVTGFRNPFNSVTGTVRIQAALTRKLALFSDYLYYSYAFDDTYALPSGLPRNLDRQGVRAGLMVLLPMIKSQVRPRAPR